MKAEITSKRVCVPVSHQRYCDIMILLQGRWPSDKGHKQAQLPVSSLLVSLLVRSVCCWLAEVCNNQKLDSITQGSFPVLCFASLVGQKRTLFFKSSFQCPGESWQAMDSTEFQLFRKEGSSEWALWPSQLIQRLPNCVRVHRKVCPYTEFFCLNFLMVNMAYLFHSKWVEKQPLLKKK